MSLVSLNAEFTELRKISSNFIYVTVLDCSGILSGKLGIDVRFTYPDFYEQYRNIFGDVNDKTLDRHLGALVIRRTDEYFVIGIIGSNISIKKTIEETDDKQTLNITANDGYNIDAIKGGLSNLNNYLLKENIKFPIIFPVDIEKHPEIVELLVDTYVGNDQFQVLMCKE